MDRQEVQKVRAYLRNIDTNEFVVVVYDPGTRRIKKGLPKDWVSKPTQFVRDTRGRAYLGHAGADMPGWMMRLVRRGKGMTQSELATRMGRKGGAASSVSYLEALPVLYPRVLTQVYKALAIDHRPGVMNPATIHAMKDFLDVSWPTLAQMVGAEPDAVKGWAYKNINPGARGLNGLYAVYCMLPDLQKGDTK
jgi:DNA-binding transcriptional regulator YiaG